MITRLWLKLARPAIIHQTTENATLSERAARVDYLIGRGGKRAGGQPTTT